MGIVCKSASWHTQYKESAWIYVGNMPYELTEGDVICVFSQYGEIVNINLVRDKKTGKSKGFAFICYEDQRSTVLAVDNLNGSKIKSRQMRVDHVQAYKVPKQDDEIDELTEKIRDKGVAPQVMHEYQDEKDEKQDGLDEYELLPVNFNAIKKKTKGKKKKKKKKYESSSSSESEEELKRQKHKKTTKSESRHRSDRKLHKSDDKSRDRSSKRTSSKSHRHRSGS